MALLNEAVLDQLPPAYDGNGNNVGRHDIPTSHAAHMFENASNVAIHDGSFTVVGGNVVTNIGTQNVYNQILHSSSDILSSLYNTLSPVEAGYDCREVQAKAVECFKGTREQVLRDIQRWITSESAPIFILDGIAGIGKTTVSMSVMTRASKEGNLGGSFFFSRDHEMRRSTRRFIPTIAYQLAQYDPTFAQQIAIAIQRNPAILQKDIRTQFVALINEPLGRILRNRRDPLLIGIDALDECNPEEAVELLGIMLQEVQRLAGLKIFATSRPERGIRILLSRSRAPHIFRLHDIEDSVVQSDVALYISSRLSLTEIEASLPDLPPPPWQPTDQEKESLVHMAGKLFIIAATSVNFILDPRRLAPAKQLKKLLEFPGKSSMSPMDRLYIQVLRSAIPDPVDDWFDNYQRVVGAITVSADVLDTTTLTQLLDLEVGEIIAALSHLHSILSPTGVNQAFRIHHKSFPDFVTDRQRCSIDPRFFIDVNGQHLFLAECCFRTMTEGLKQNTCDLPHRDWYKDLSQIPRDTKGRIGKHLAYSCTYWAFHLEQANFNDHGERVVTLLHSFAVKQIVLWMEVLSFIGRFDIALSSLDTANMILEKLVVTLPKVHEIKEILQDARRFISFHPDVIQRAPMHIYLSCLPFIPSEVKISHLCRDLLGNSIRVVSGRTRHWDAVHATLPHLREIHAFAYSPDGNTIATLSPFGREPPKHSKELDSQECSIRVWDVKNGSLIRELFDGGVYSNRFGGDGPPPAAISNSGHLLAIVQRPWTVQIWDVGKGTVIRTLADPIHLTITCVGFSADGTRLAVGLMDGEVQICSFCNGSWEMSHKGLKTFLYHLPNDTDAYILNLHFFGPESQWLVVCTANGTTCWDMDSLSCNKSIPDCLGVDILCLSPNAKMVALQTNKYDIQIHLSSSPKVTSLVGHSDEVISAEFSPDSTHLLSASRDFTLVLWDVNSASQLRRVNHPEVVCDLRYSPNLSAFVSIDDRNRINHWDHNLTSTDLGNLPSSVHMGISPNGSTAVSALESSLQIYDMTLITPPPTDSDTNSSTNDGHLMTMPFVTFSPNGTTAVSTAFGDSFEPRQLWRVIGTTLDPLDWPFPDNVESFAYSPDSSKLAFQKYNGSIEVWDVTSFEKRRIWKGGVKVHGALVQQILQFSPDSLKLAVHSGSIENDSRILLWDIHSGEITFKTTKPIWSRDDISIENGAVVFSPDGSDLLLRREELVVIRPSNPQKIRRVFLPYAKDCNWAHFNLVAFSPNGQIVATASEDSYLGPSIRVWRRPMYGHVATLTDHRHESTICTLNFADDGRYLISQSTEALTIWDGVSYERISQFVPESMMINGMHSYGPRDYLLLVKKLSPMTSGLLVVKFLEGGKVEWDALCWFPPSVDVSRLSVHPTQPLVVVAGAKFNHRTTLHLDISQFRLEYFFAT